MHGRRIRIEGKYFSSIELNLSIEIDVSEYEFRSSYSCSSIAWIEWDVSKDDRNEDSSWRFAMRIKRRREQ